MKLAWLNAKSSSWGNVVNKRALPTTASGAVGTIDSNGELVYYLSSQHESDGNWYKFKSVVTSKEYWCREDVVNYHVLNSESRMLPVPYVSQRDENSKLSNNDCGHASACMLLRYVGVDCTVDEYNERVGLTTGFTSFDYHIRGMNLYRQDAKHKRPFHISDYLAAIDSGLPVFSLVDYGVFFSNRRYGHFLVVIGYEIINGQLNIIVHDPYEEPEMHYTAEKFSNAISNRFFSTNMPYQALLPEYSNPLPSINDEGDEQLDNKKYPNELITAVQLADRMVDELKLQIESIKNIL